LHAPVKFKLDTSTDHADEWQRVAPLWHDLNTSVRGNPAFSALTIKGAYVVGVIYGICQSVTCLLAASQVFKEVTYIPAYGVFASGVELLGRCINGNHTNQGNSGDLKTGFKYMASASPETITDGDILVRTSYGQYTIEQLISLRHFAAHGQATAQFTSFDNQILAAMPPLIAHGLERYWIALQKDADLCNNLARANVLALRNVPIFTSWSLFERDANGVYHSITEIFNRFDWRV